MATDELSMRQLSNEEIRNALLIIKEELQGSVFRKLFTKRYINHINAALIDNKLRIGTNSTFELPIIQKIFNSSAINRKNDYGMFYHFKKWDYAEDIILNQKIKLFSLKAQLENDFTEQIEFFKRYQNPISDRYSTDFKNLVNKETNFVFCFTSSYRNTRFWESYVQPENGVCLGFRFNSFRNKEIVNSIANLRGIKSKMTKESLFEYQFRDVFYDSGYDFEILNEIRYKVLLKINKEIELSPKDNYWFPAFYKRAKYSWENETRILIDLSAIYTSDFNFISNPENGFTKSNINDKKLLEVNLNNGLFQLELCEVIISNKIPKLKQQEIISLCKKMDIKYWVYHIY